MTLWQSRGDLLRWWRTQVAGLSQKAMAEVLGVARTAVTNWESASRFSSLQLREIDAATGAGGTLEGMLWSFGAPAGIEAGRIWTHVFPGESSPVWMWVRSSSARIEISAEWGLYAFSVEQEMPPNGIFVTVGASVDQSPILVALSEPGWVEFGRGRLPEKVEGADVLQAIDIVEPSSASPSAFQQLFSSTLKPVAEEALKREGEDHHVVADALSSFLSSLEARGQHPAPFEALPEGLERAERGCYRQLRESRNLSLTETLARLKRATGVVIGKDTLRRFEAGQGVPHDPVLPAALDCVLGANGRLAFNAVRSGNGEATVQFPSWWKAPVWLAFDRQDGIQLDGLVAELEWDGWKKLVIGATPQTWIIHGGPTRLRILTEPSMQWVVGVGRPATAVPLDHGWLPKDLDTTHEVLAKYQEVLATAVNERVVRRNP